MNLFGWTIQILLLALMSESVPFLGGPEDLMLHEGDSGQLTCTGSNVTSWYNATDDSVTIGNSPNLTVSASGLYYCRVEHGTTLVRSCPADVSLVTFKEPPSSKNITMTVHRTNDIILSSCQHVHSVPPPVIDWTFNDGLLPKNVVILPSGSLLIPELKYSDHLGNYSCVAINPVTKEEWHSHITTLIRAPPSNTGNVVFQDTPINVTAVVGESVTLECAPAGEIKINVSWTPMPSNSQLYNERYGGVLRIDNVMLSNGGVYNCSYTWSHENYTANDNRQFYLTVQATPNISNLMVSQNSTTAVLNCMYTGHPTPMILWHTPSGVTTFAEGSSLTIPNLGPEAAGVYQCYVVSDIGCDHREVRLSIPIDFVTTSSTSMASAYSSIIDTSSVDFSFSIFSHTLSGTAAIGPIMTSSISPSSVSVDPLSATIDTSSFSIGPISSVVSSSVSVDLISSRSDVSSSSISVSPPIFDATSSSTPFVSSAIVASSPSSSSISRLSVTPTDSSLGRTPSASEVYSSTTLTTSTVDSSTDMVSRSSAGISHTPLILPSSVFVRTSDVAMITSHTLSSMISDIPSSSSSEVSLSSTSSRDIVTSDIADHSSVVTDVIASTSTTAVDDSSSTTMIASTTSSSPIPSSSSPTPSSSSSTASSTSYVTPTTTVSPTPTVGIPVTMVTGIEFTWVREDVVRVQWDPVINENIVGYKITWDSKMIESPNAAFTATNISEYEIPLMENVATVYIYIWAYNFVGDGPVTPTSVVRPITNMKCQNISISSAHVDWTILNPVSKYQVTAHCSRTGKTVTTEVEGDKTSSMASLLLESLEPDCIYAITIMPDGYNDYSLQCIVFTAGKPVTMVTGIEFTWIGEDVVRVQWDPVTNENILGYKISWDSKMIESPNAAFTATNISEYEIPLMENVATVYIYIWAYNYLGDGPVTPTSVVRPITNMKCQNISIFSARVNWTILNPVSKYQVTTHCSRTGKTVTKEVEGDEAASMASLLLESLEPDCIYAITIMPEGYNDYSLQCIVFTAEPSIFVEIAKNDSFVNGFTIQWKLYNFENISEELITMEVQVGSQIWPISNPLKLSEFVNLTITQKGKREFKVSIIITIGNMWKINKTVNFVINKEQPTDGDQSSLEDDEDDNSLTWIFYVIAFGSVVAIVILVIATIIVLKHVQIRRREFDKITNHREKIMASFKHENANGQPAVETPRYIVV